jgi:hypothetical protein
LADSTVTRTPAWGEYAITQSPQWFDAIAGQVARHDVFGLTTIAGSNDTVLVLHDSVGEVVLQRTGRFIVCGSTYVQGSIEDANPNFTIDVMGALIFKIPDGAAAGVRTHELRLGQTGIPMTADGNMQDSGFSFSGCTTLMLPAGTKISLRVGIFADNLTQGNFIRWQARGDSAAGGANLSIHEI